MRFCYLVPFTIIGSSSATIAADLPSRKSAPVEFVRVCSEHGTGFFYIPGADTCLRVAGRIRAEYRYEEPFSRNDNAIRFRARGYLTFDSRSSTEWGILRATSRIYVTKDTGSAATTTLDYGYIQFAGITAGRLQNSFFDFSPIGDYAYIDADVLGRGSWRQSINALAYTMTFAKGLSGTISLEDRTERDAGVYSYTPFATVGWTGFATQTVAYAGQTMPDVVGRLQWDADWGTAVLTGAVHQVRLGGPFAPPFNGIPPSGAGGVVGTDYGYAIGAGLKLNLPQLGAGDQLEVSAVWANGASDYTGWRQANAGTLRPFVGDALLVPGTLSQSLSKSYSLSAGYRHYWTSSVRQHLFGSYGAIDQYGAYFNATSYTLGTNIQWLPVRGLEIGGEVYYSRLSGSPISAYPYSVPQQAFFFGGQHSDNWGGRVRFQRDF